MATISFNLWGEMSPTKPTSPPSIQSTSASHQDEEKKKMESESEKSDRLSTPKRSIGQAEIESSYFKVKLIFIAQLFCCLWFFQCLISTMAHSEIIWRC